IREIPGIPRRGGAGAHSRSVRRRHLRRRRARLEGAGAAALRRAARRVSAPHRVARARDRTAAARHRRQCRAMARAGAARAARRLAARRWLGADAVRQSRRRSRGAGAAGTGPAHLRHRRRAAWRAGAALRRLLPQRAVRRMTQTDRSLLRLARLAGIAPSYRDAWNKQRRVTPETLRQILGAMGLAATTQGDVAAALAELEAEKWRALLPPVVTALDDEPATVPVTVADAQEQRVSWTLMLESGEQREGAATPDELNVLGAKRRIRRLALSVGHGLPLGYH